MTHRLACLVALTLAASATLAAPAKLSDADALARANAFLANHLLVDGHNDLPWAIREYEPAPNDLDAYDLRQHTAGDTDLARLKAGHLGAQFWSVYVPGEPASGHARMQLEQIELARRMIAKYPDALALATTADEVEAAHASGRIASLLGMEGGHAIENSLGALRAYYDLGVRYMTLTHNSQLDWADTAAVQPGKHHGLTAFGREVVAEMNRLGMLVDLSHTSVETQRDVLAVAKAPVIFSHSNAAALCDVPRNVPDDVLRLVKRNGGVVMITFVTGFVSADAAKIMQPAMVKYNARIAGISDETQRQKIWSEIFDGIDIPRVTIAQVADHIDHVVKVAGIDHVGLGGDFDGNDDWPDGLSDVSMYPNLFAELIRRGWSDADLAKLAGGNAMRVLRRAEAVSKELSAKTPPSIRRIDAVDAVDAVKETTK